MRQKAADMPPLVSRKQPRDRGMVSLVLDASPDQVGQEYELCAWKFTSADLPVLRLWQQADKEMTR